MVIILNGPEKEDNDLSLSYEDGILTISVSDEESGMSFEVKDSAELIAAINFIHKTQ